MSFSFLSQETEYLIVRPLGKFLVISPPKSFSFSFDSVEKLAQDYVNFNPSSDYSESNSRSLSSPEAFSVCTVV